MGNPNLPQPYPEWGSELDHKIRLTLEELESALIINMHGRVDGANAPLFEDEARKIAKNFSDRAVIMDLENLIYISSAGLRVLLQISKSVRSEQKPFVLCNLSAPVMELVMISGFDKIMDVCDSRAAALAQAGL